MKLRKTDLSGGSGTSPRCAQRVPWPAATRDALIAAHLVAGRALIRHGRLIAEKLGVAWPAPLEVAVRAHLQRELDVAL